MSVQPLLVVLGPTASGKTRLAVKLASELRGEVISADSRQVFKGMDIGTGKDLHEYRIDGSLIPYHLINHKTAGERYQVNAFKEDFYEIFNALHLRRRLPIVCGGTGMYIHSILQEHEYTAVPVSEKLRSEIKDLGLAELKKILLEYPRSFWNHADQSTSKRLIRAIEIADYLSKNTLEKKIRPVFEPLVIGLTSDIASRRERIAQRLDQRLQSGLIEEVQDLMEIGVSADTLIFYGLEYKFVVAYLQHELNFEQLRERLMIAICQFAKRQMTFFRKMEKDGVKIHWFDIDVCDDLYASALSCFNITFPGLEL
ncbi:tRNA (adenosine(37)-N6)-dimethylallyltransferase MiaA [Pedobacter nutrimenti]|uniref:tRNA dimethylallyltransferase n=1 Tax=Pedobacter nutrimenti TaxID=1241337 RepID=A0A318US35_9SPHI|nr:tRNA (adenosine(37)-N6)-dimethylallyltransferase MiaA [Pedobacter nutrimenti]PYF76895.1 tRNA dimethylallyltransferase [Pedobacter nutrimenti]